MAGYLRIVEKTKNMLIRLLTLIIFTFFVQVSYGQEVSEDDRALIDKMLAEYGAATIDADYGKLTDYIYPKLFDLASKEDMIEMLESSMKTKDYSMDFISFKTDSVDSISTFSEGKFTQIHYTASFNIDYTEAASKQLKQMIKATFQSMGGNLTESEVENRHSVVWSKTLIAIDDNTTDGWKIIEKKTGSQAAMLAILLPEEVYSVVYDSFVSN